MSSEERQTKLRQDLPFIILFILGLLISEINGADIYIYQDMVIHDGDDYMGDCFLVYNSPPDVTTLTMQGGQVSWVRTHDSSVFDMKYGRVYGIETYDQSKCTVVDTYLRVQSFDCYNSSQTTISGGLISSIFFRDSSTGVIHDGSFLSGPSARDWSNLTVYGGNMGTLDCVGFSVINMYGGVVENTVAAANNATLNIFGGTIGNRLQGWHDSKINIYGYGFLYDPNGGSYGYGHIAGFYLDGKPFNINLWENTYSHINLIPEPATVLLLGLGGLAILRKRRVLKPD